MTEESKIIAREVAAIKAAPTLCGLDALYVQYIGYSRLDDEPNVSAASLRGDLLDYQREICAASGTDCSSVGL